MNKYIRITVQNYEKEINKSVHLSALIEKETMVIFYS